MTLTRTRLAIGMLENLLQCDAFIFQFKYPRFSYTCWIGLHIFIHFFEMKLLFSYICIAFIWLVFAYSKPWEQNITPFLKKTFFSHSLRHPL